MLVRGYLLFLGAKDGGVLSGIACILIFCCLLLVMYAETDQRGVLASEGGIVSLISPSPFHMCAGGVGRQARMRYSLAAFLGVQISIKYRRERAPFFVVCVWMFVTNGENKKTKLTHLY